MATYPLFLPCSTPTPAFPSTSSYQILLNLVRVRPLSSSEGPLPAPFGASNLFSQEALAIDSTPSLHVHPLKSDPLVIWV